LGSGCTYEVPWWSIVVEGEVKHSEEHCDPNGVDIDRLQDEVAASGSEDMSGPVAAAAAAGELDSAGDDEESERRRRDSSWE
jgi:hypothetical protein